jgi:hypothetical protein
MSAHGETPMQVEIRKYPQLRALCWSRPDDAVLEGKDALALYERSWRFVEERDLLPEERRLLETLVATYGGGVLNV